MYPKCVASNAVRRYTSSSKTFAFVRQQSNTSKNQSQSIVNVVFQGRNLLSLPIPIPRSEPIVVRTLYRPKSFTRLMSTTSNTGKPPEIIHIGREQMEEIIEDYESGGREESQYCIIDVRTEEEVYSTGKISENVYTLPVQVIMQAKVFDMDPEEFEEFCNFPKPTFDETIVFTCAAGMRSVSACHFAAQSGYTKLINYSGGANEWFAS
jgi:rhodanese-related sulfurtransferase